MPKYINPNNNEVDLDLGNPSRRHAVIAQWGKPAQHGRVRVVEMSAAKAKQFCELGMIVLLNAEVAKVTPADLDVTAMEASFQAADPRRVVRTDPAEAAAHKARSDAALAEFRAKEARELADAALGRTATANAQAKADARAEADAGIVTGGVEPTGTSAPEGAVHVAPAGAAAPAPTVTDKPAGSRMPAAVGVDETETVENGQKVEPVTAANGSKMPASVGTDDETE